MMRDFPKPMKKIIRHYLSIAYERELRRELTKLDKCFETWRKGNITSFDLSDNVLRYCRGPGRKLAKQNNDSPEDMQVAYAIATGILSEDEVPPELLKALSRQLSFYREMGHLREE